MTLNNTSWKNNESVSNLYGKSENYKRSLEERDSVIRNLLVESKNYKEKV